MDSLELLYYAYFAFPYGVAFLLAAGLVALALGMYRNPAVGAVAVLVLAVWETAEYKLGALRLGLTVYPHDVLFACLGSVTLTRLAVTPGALRAVPRSLLLLLAVMTASFAVGLVRHGTAAGVEFRQDFYFWTGCLYFLSFRPEARWLDRLMSWWSLAAALICVIVWYRWAADAYDLRWFDPIWHYVDSTAVGFRRVAPASVAFMLGLASLVSIARLATGHAHALHYLLLPALIVSIVLLQHRSVWVATLLPAVLLLLLMLAARRGGGHRHSALRPVIAAVVALAAVGALLASGRMERVSTSIEQQAESATSTTGGTFVARVEGWKELLSKWTHSGPVGLAVGQPYGSGFKRHEGKTWGGVEVSYAPHNYFVTVLLRTGVVGLLALLVLLWRIGAAGLAPARWEGSLSPSLIAAIVLAFVLFCIPYSPTFEASVLVGAALACARREPKRSDPAKGPVALRGAPRPWRPSQVREITLRP